MFGVLSYQEMLDIQTSRFSIPDEKGHRPSVRMIGVLFARPESNLAAKEVVPNLGYFHVRSGKHVDFFCAGYGPDDPREPVNRINVSDMGWKFYPAKFNDLRQELEPPRTNWRYSGGTDLILTNARLEPNTLRAFFDFETTVKCYLDEMIRIGAIPSVEEFFERIFRYAESASGDDPTWGFSDAEGLNAGKQSLINLLLSLLPKNLGKELRRVAVFAASKRSA